MNFLQKIENYGDTHHPMWLDIIRVSLGVILFFKGIHFVSDTTTLLEMIQNSPFTAWAVVLAHYVGFAHLVGGLCIAIGLITRTAVLFQLPVLIGAVFFINAPRGIYAVGSELEYSILVLFLLIFFLIYGSGPLSADAMIKKSKEK
jgi:putative oxidoreductase